MFAGIGGFRTGLTRAGGFRCVGHCEIDKYANASYEAIYEPGKEERYYHDATKIDPADLPDFDLLCGGFPCQTFSIAGKRKGFDDTRGTLFFEIARLAQSKRPSYLLLENVPGLLSHDKGRTFSVILATLNDLGYRVEWMVLNSKHFGVPQSRRRLFLICYLDPRCAGKIFPVFGAGGKALIQVLGGSQGSRVYDADGIACTQTAGAGGVGGKTGLYIIPQDRPFVDLCAGEARQTEAARCLTARYGQTTLSNHRAERSGVLLIKAYHTDRGDFNRTKIIVPDSAHGTNPATAAMCGFQVINIPSGVDGCVDLDALRAAVGPDTAGLMLTNPNTVGIFDKNILEITKIIHDAGGLCYYDGANLNAVMGVVRPGDMGFDCIHSNLHKTFATPHGGGGPGAGAVGCKEFLKKYMPGPLVVKKDGKYGFASPEKSIGRVKMFYGNFDVVVRALTYVLTLGKSGIREAAMNAVLNANYMRVRLKDTFTMAYDEICMHEFVMSLVDLHKETGVSALDLAKGMLDFGLHPPTMYFPLIVHEALMIEPCETESKETMDEVCGIYCKLFELAHSDPETLHTAPHSTPVRRLDEVGAARNMILRYSFAQ